MSDTTDTATKPASSRYASRKFLIALLVVLSATWLVYLGRIGDAVYQVIVLGVVTVYLGANVAQRFVDKKAAP
jgi:hypothetical protein